MQEGTQLSTVIRSAAEESTCQKRVIVCVLLAQDGSVVAAGANRCTPPSSGCPRLNLQVTRTNYNNAGCSPEHAEMNALARVPAGLRPVHAIIYGHDFVCPSCSRALKEREISFEIHPEGHGTGLRCSNPSS